MSDFDDFQLRINEVYPNDKALEYITLQLASDVGQIASEVAHLVRGDHVDKGVFVYEAMIEKILDESRNVLICVALIATVLEKSMSDIVNRGERNAHT